MPIHPHAEEQIDAYIASAPEFARPICRELRRIIRAADPGIVEDWKWGPNFNKQGMVCGFGAFKAHVTLTFFKGALLKDPKKLLEDCSGSNAHNRSLKFRAPGDVDGKAVTSFVREAVALNVKGVRAESRRAEIPVPADLLAALSRNAKAKKGFLKLAPGCRREYLEWITQAKRAETRAARIEKTVGLVVRGKGLNDQYR